MKFFYKFIPPFIQKFIKTTCQEKTKGGLIDTKNRRDKPYSTTKKEQHAVIPFLVVAHSQN